MKLNIIAITSALASLASALPQAAVQKSNDTALASAVPVQANYDVVVVGGGPAGLAAASALARVRRNVLLIDSGEYRNQYTRRIHDVLGFDGTVLDETRFGKPS